MNEQEHKKLKSNINSAMLFLVGSNFAGAIILLLIYRNTRENVYLIAAIILLLAGFASIFLAQRMYKQIVRLSEKEKTSENADSSNQ
jgi:Kef-type K+ transport system membrane component KefB